MDESLQELENELKALRPQRPSVLLRARIERDLAAPAAVESPRRYTSATTLRSWKWFSWQSAAAVAAGVVLAVSVGRWQERTRDGQLPSVGLSQAQNVPAAGASDRTPRGDAAGPVGVESYVPVSAASVLYDLRDEGAVTLEGDQAARQARFRYVDTYTWKNPATNASLRFSVPRDEVRVVPAYFH